MTFPRLTYQAAQIPNKPSFEQIQALRREAVQELTANVAQHWKRCPDCDWPVQKSVAIHRGSVVCLERRYVKLKGLIEVEGWVAKQVAMAEYPIAWASVFNIHAPWGATYAKVKKSRKTFAPELPARFVRRAYRCVPANKLGFALRMFSRYSTDFQMARVAELEIADDDKFVRDTINQMAKECKLVLEEERMENIRKELADSSGAVAQR